MDTPRVNSCQMPRANPNMAWKGVKTTLSTLGSGEVSMPVFAWRITRQPISRARQSSKRALYWHMSQPNEHELPSRSEIMTLTSRPLMASGAGPSNAMTASNEASGNSSGGVEGEDDGGEIILLGWD